MAEINGSLELHSHADAISSHECMLEDVNSQTFDDLHLITDKISAAGRATTMFADLRIIYEAAEHSQTHRCWDTSSTSLESAEEEGVWPLAVLPSDPPLSNSVTIGVPPWTSSLQLHSVTPTSADDQLRLRLNAVMCENEALKLDCSILAKENHRLSKDVESLHATLMTVQSGLIEFRNERSEMSDKIAMLSKEVAGWKKLGLQLNASARGDAAGESPDLAELQKLAEKLQQENISQRNEQLEVLQNVRCLSERQARHWKSKARKASQNNARLNTRKLELRKKLHRNRKTHKAREVELQVIIEKTTHISTQLRAAVLNMRVHCSSSDSDIRQVEDGKQSLETSPRLHDSAKPRQDAITTEENNAVRLEEAYGEDVPKTKVRRSRLSRFFRCFMPHRN